MSTTESAGTNFSGMFSSIGAVAANYLQDKMLKKMDTDGSGTVGQSEFKAALEQVGTKLGVDAGDSSQADAMFASVDSNGDGSLTGNEVGQMLKNMFAGTGGTDAFVQSRGDQQRFSELDTDGDGSISMAEFGIDSSASSALTTSTSAEDTAVASTADTSATAPLNEDALQALLGQVDSDNDGQLSNAEITAFANQMGTQLQAASQKYNETAMASFSTSGNTSQVNTAA
jgi:Ca2+-binding EF-hand superfamily protein